MYMLTSFLPALLGSKESAKNLQRICLQCRRPGFNPWEDPLEKGMATQSILAWRFPWREEPGGLQFVGSQRVRHDWAAKTFTFTSSITGLSDSFPSWIMSFRSTFSNGFSGSSAGKESACNAGALGLVPGLGRSLGEGIVYPLWYSGLENAMDRGVRQAPVHGVTKSRTQLSDFHSLYVRVSWQKPSVHIIFTFILNNTFSKHWSYHFHVFWLPLFYWKIGCLSICLSCVSNVSLLSTSKDNFSLLFCCFIMRCVRVVFCLFCLVFVWLPKYENQCLSAVWDKNLCHYLFKWYFSSIFFSVQTLIKAFYETLLTHMLSSIQLSFMFSLFFIFAISLPLTAVSWVFFFPSWFLFLDYFFYFCVSILVFCYSFSCHLFQSYVSFLQCLFVIFQISLVNFDNLGSFNISLKYRKGNSFLFCILFTLIMVLQSSHFWICSLLFFSDTLIP